MFYCLEIWEGFRSEEHFQEVIAHLFNNPNFKKKLIIIMYPVYTSNTLRPLDALSHKRDY